MSEEKSAKPVEEIKDKELDEVQGGLGISPQDDVSTKFYSADRFNTATKFNTASGLGTGDGIDSINDSPLKR